MRKATLSVYDTNLCFKPTNCVRKSYRATQIAVNVTNVATDKIDDFEGMIKSGMTIACFDAIQGRSDIPKIEASLSKLKEALESYNKKRANELKSKIAQLKDTTSQEPTCCDANVATALNLKPVFLETEKFEEDTTFVKDTDVKLTNVKTKADPNDKDKSEQTKTTKDEIVVECDNLSEVPVGTTVYINHTTILTVTKNIDANSIECKVVVPGEKISKDTKCEVNISGFKTALDGAVEDIQALATFCRKNNITIMIVPVENAKSMKSIRCVINPDGSDSEKEIKVIARVESYDAANNIDTIVEQASGVLIGRKRLGRNLCTEQVPTYQKMIIAKCLQKGIPSIIANHVMKQSGDDGIKGPTRAEVADVFNAVLDGVDCVFLGTKAAKPEAINSLKFAIFEAEDTINYRRLNRDLVTRLEVPCNPVHCNYFADSLALSAATCAMVNGASCIIVLSDSGKTARYIAKYRPQAPIIVVAKEKFVAERCMMHCGVMAIVPPPRESSKDSKGTPVPVSYHEEVENRIKVGIQFARLCSVMNKLPSVAIVVYASKDNMNKTDTVS